MPNPVEQTAALTLKQIHDIGKASFQKWEGRDLPFEGVMPWVADAINEGFKRALATPPKGQVPVGWTAVSDRLPEKFTEVLIAYRDTTLPSTGQYTDNPNDTHWGWCVPSENDCDDTGPVTHWMPLPDSPGAAAPAQGGVPDERLIAVSQRSPNLLIDVAAGQGGEPKADVQAASEAPAELRGLDTAKRIRFYEHDFYVLSNFSAFSLFMWGMRFDTSEAAYHFAKFAGPYCNDDAHFTLRESIITAPSAHEAFKIAEKNKPLRRPDWDEAKVPIMLEILRAKADQHEYVNRKLLATGDRELVEDSWRDDFWGWGPNRDGQNMLGKLWMQVRDELRASERKDTQ